jgi:hypothetical protein
LAKTEIRGGQIKDTSVQRSDLDISTIGEAVVRRIIAGTNVTLGSTGVDTGTGDVTINSSGGGGFTWSEVTGTTQAGTVENGYITNNASQVVVTLPSTAVLGSVIRITGKGAGGWKLAQNALQIIKFTSGGVEGVNQTTTGTTGFVASNDSEDSIEILCTTADTTWKVISHEGNLIID